MPKNISTTKDKGFASQDTASSTYRKTDEELSSARQKFLNRIALQRSRKKLSQTPRNPYRIKQNNRTTVETD